MAWHRLLRPGPRIRESFKMANRLMNWPARRVTCGEAAGDISGLVGLEGCGAGQTLWVPQDAYRRLLALYRAGYEPDTPRLLNMARDLGWADCMLLARATAQYPLVTLVITPGRRRLCALEMAHAVDWACPESSVIDGVIIMPRGNRTEWWLGGSA